MATKEAACGHLRKGGADFGRSPLWKPLWLCSYVAMWLCGYEAMWLYGYVAMLRILNLVLLIINALQPDAGSMHLRLLEIFFVDLGSI